MTAANQTAPAQAGFIMPAEWMPHQKTWMAWPYRKTLWGSKIDAVRLAYARAAQAIARFEPVSMLVPPDLMEQAKELCGTGVELVPLALDDSWTRDTGPTFLMDAAGNQAGVDWEFNGWGGVETEIEKDKAIARFILETEGIRRFAPGLILEGGSIHVDGQGTLITTEECLLNPNRNPHLHKQKIEQILKDYLGVQKFIWLGKGMDGDETSGHVDNVACFVRPGVILMQGPYEPGDPNRQITKGNLDRLSAARDSRGRDLEVVLVKPPAPEYGDDGSRLNLSYINFYFCNQGLVVPRFGCPEDDAALGVFRELFPGREIVQVNALDIACGGGGIHCITQQQPAHLESTEATVGNHGL